MICRAPPIEASCSVSAATRPSSRIASSRASAAMRASSAIFSWERTSATWSAMRRAMSASSSRYCATVAREEVQAADDFALQPDRHAEQRADPVPLHELELLACSSRARGGCRARGRNSSPRSRASSSIGGSFAACPATARPYTRGCARSCGPAERSPSAIRSCGRIPPTAAESWSNTSRMSSAFESVGRRASSASLRFRRSLSFAKSCSCWSASRAGRRSRGPWLRRRDRRRRLRSTRTRCCRENAGRGGASR